MKPFIPVLVAIFGILLLSCPQHTAPDFSGPGPSIEGNQEYLSSPFVTAGDRLYVVGNQDGSFPDLGWHVPGEMGGIWDHPIKLMDGYAFHLGDDDGLDWCLSDAYNFVNYPHGNQHLFQNLNAGLEAARSQFVPDGLEGVIIEYQISNTSNRSRSLTLTFSGMVDLRPVWLSDSLGITDGRDGTYWDMDRSMVIAKDSLNSWFCVFGGDGPYRYHYENPCATDRKGLGLDVSLSTALEIRKGETKTLHFYVAGSDQSLQSAASTLETLRSQKDQLLKGKVNRFAGIATTNRLILEDSAMMEMFEWTKYNLDWLIRDVPDLGRGFSAGLPDYPWWFGTDNGYTIQGALAAGMHSEALSTIDLMMELSRKRNNGNGRIVHEVSTNGAVYNPGNLNTTPNWIYALWKAYEWTGDPAIPTNYYEDVIRGIRWLESQDRDGNGYPDGAGMMEIPGLHTEMIDVVVYQAKAYQAAANFALVQGDTILQKELFRKAERLTERINTDWWVETSGSYADFRATKAQTLELIESAIIRADTINKPWSVQELKGIQAEVSTGSGEGIRGYVVHHNWVVNTPMEMGLADPGKAVIALETARKYRNRFGMFVTGIDRDEAQEEAAKWKSFSYVGAVMTLPTGVQAITEARYGNPDEALRYLKMLNNSFSYALPGSMYEVSPDFGMVTQAWSIYAVAVPFVQHFFGIYPMAYAQRVAIAPDMPAEWQSAALKDVVVGDNRIGISFSRENGTVQYTITQSDPAWTILFESSVRGKITLNGQPVIVEEPEGKYMIPVSGEKNEIVIRLQSR